MSLATRCTSCGTIFRVVQDQLKVSEGWVRCGRCQNVFNALQNLFDLDREQPPPWPPASEPEPASETPTWAATQPMGPGDRVPPVGTGAPPSSPAGTAAGAAAATTIARSATAPATVDRPTTPSRASPAAVAPAPARTAASPAMDVAAAARAAQPRAPAASALAAAPSSPSLLHTASRDIEATVDTGELSTQPQQHPPPDHDDAESSGFLHARFNLDLVEDRSPAAAAIAAIHAPAATAASEPAPLFIRQAEAAARWRQPRVRAGLALLLVLMSVTLLGQIALQFHDPLAAAWPQARGLLQAMCDQFDCRIEPPRRLASLTVDASGLTRTTVPGAYRLSVSLHNHSQTVVMVPAVDLSLTDSQGRLFARRALLAKDLGAAQASIAPGADLTLQAVLSTGAERVVGYTVEIFYP